MALGVTFLNKHCFVNDMKKTRLDSGATLLSRSHEIRLEVLQSVMGWNLVVIDLAEYMELFNKGKDAKEEREQYIMTRIKLQEEPEQ